MHPLRPAPLDRICPLPESSSEWYRFVFIRLRCWFTYKQCVDSSHFVTSPSSGYTGQDIDSSRKLNALESGGKFELDDMSNSQASKEFQRAREQERERLERQRERRERRERKARDNADEEGDSEGVKTMQQHSIPV